MLEIDLVSKGEEHYKEVCETAKDVYKQELCVNLESFPPMFIFMKEDGAVVGSVGFWRGDEKEKMLAEKYCEVEGVDLAEVFSRHGVVSRSEIGEVCCLNARQPYRRNVPVLFSLIHEHCHATGIKIALLTQSKSLRKTFSDLGMMVNILCFPEIDRCRDVLDNPDQWAEVYFRLKPACSFIAVAESIKSHREKIIAKPGILSPFRIGEKLSVALN